jgi:hypothetical protein
LVQVKINNINPDKSTTNVSEVRILPFNPFDFLLLLGLSCSPNKG